MQPTGITADRTNALLIITWDDGERSEIPFKLLSDLCPCATCNEERQNSDPLKIVRARSYELETIVPVGNYAINIIWRGGCRFGLYSWEYLRKIADLPRGASG